MTIDEQIAALEAAMANGEIKVTFPDGASVQYADADDLLKRYTFLVGKKAAGGGSNYRVARARFVC